MIEYPQNSQDLDYVLDEHIGTSTFRTVALESKTSFINTIGQRVYPRFYPRFHHLETETQYITAREPILRHFDKNSATVTFGEAIRAEIITPTFVLIDTRHIVVCRINCESENSS